jgi:putative transcriptional regulator
MAAPPEKGRLLVASPTLEDPNFRRSVVFLLAADEDGALGVILNRPSETPVGEIVPAWGLHTSEPRVLFSGGPVQPNAAICVGRAATEVPTQDPDDESSGYSALVDDLGTVDLHRSPEEIEVPLHGLRVFTGYSGWGPGQLEEEIESGAWFVLEGRHSDVLSADPEGLWPRVLRRQGGWLAVLARHPVDASLN